MSDSAFIPRSDGQPLEVAPEPVVLEHSHAPSLPGPIWQSTGHASQRTLSAAIRSGTRECSRTTGSGATSSG